MNFERLYEYRLRGISPEVRRCVWSLVAKYVFDLLGRPRKILDPAAGRCEFIHSVPAAEKWAVDAVDYTKVLGDAQVKFLVGDVNLIKLPEAYFEGIFVSNFLEHLRGAEEVSRFLSRTYQWLAPGGKIAVLGPNFKYCVREYFDCADHQSPLTHTSVAEHLYASGFEIEKVIPRFLPFSFRGAVLVHPALVKIYLAVPILWRFFGKQFLVVARKPAAS